MLEAMKAFVRNRPGLILALTLVLVVLPVVLIAILTLLGPVIGGTMYNEVAMLGGDAAFAPPPAPSVARTGTDGTLALTEFDAETSKLSEEEEPQQERVILRDATLRITVENTPATIDEIGAMAEGMGGWVVTASSSSTTTYDEREVTSGNITVRVPAEQLDSVLASIREMSLNVSYEAVNGRDVTEEYVDLSSRLRNLTASEDQLINVLETADTVEDVLAVRRELTNVRGEIETIEGRLRFYDQAAAFSSVAVTISERVPSVGNVELPGWSPGSTLANAFGTLIVVLQWLVDAAIMLVIVGVPVIVALWAVVWVLRRVWRVLRRGRQGQQQEEQSTS